MAEDASANVFSLEASISIDTTNFEKKIAKIKESGIILQQTMEKGIKSVKALQQFLNGFDTTKFKQSVKGIGDGLGDIGDSAEDSSGSIDDIGNSVEDSAEKSKTAFGSLQSSISETAANFGKITAAVGKVIDAIKKIGEVAVKSFKIAVKAGKEFTESIVDIVEKSNDIENKLSLVFGGAGTAIGAYSFATGKDFETSMANVLAIMGKTKESVTEDGVNIYNMLESAAREAGATTMFTATQSADALSYLALAGYDAYKAVNALPHVLEIAKAGNMDLAYASDLVTDAMNAMGLETNDENLTHFGDVLAKTASSSNTSVAQLGEAMLVCAGQARIANVDLEDTATMLGILADAGYKGAEGGTLFRNLLKNMYTPTAAALKTMETFGLDRIDRETGQIKNVQVFLSEIMSTVSSLEAEEDKLQLYADLFDTRVIAGANIALEKCVDRYDELRGKIGDCDGAMELMGETMSDTLVGDMQLMTSSLEAVGIAIFNHIVNPMRDAVQEVTNYMAELQAIIDEHGISVGAFHIGDMIDESLEKNTPSITGFMEEAEAVIRRFVQGFTDNIPNISENISQIIQKFGEVRDEIFNSVFEVFRKDENSTGLVNIGATILDTMLTTAENVTNTLAENLPQFIDKIADSLSENKDSWTKSITAIIKNISDLIVKSAPALVEIGGTLLVAIVQGMATTTTEITKILPQILDEFTKLLSDKEFSESLQLAFKQIIGDIGDIIVMLVKFMAEPNNTKFILDIIGNILREITNTLDEITPELMAAVKPIAEKMMIFFNEELFPFIVTIKGIGISIGSAFFEGIWDGIKHSKILGFLPSLSEIYNSIAESNTEWYNAHYGNKKGISQDVDSSSPLDAYISEDVPIADYVSGINNDISKYSDINNNSGFMQGLNTSMANLVSNMDFSWATELGSKLVTNIGTGISTAWETIKENVRNIFSFLDFSDEIEAAKEYGGNFIMNLSSSAIQKWGNWKDSVARIFDFFDLSQEAEETKVQGENFMVNFASSIVHKWGEWSGSVLTIFDLFDLSHLSESAWTWGSDMIQNFITGMKEESGKLSETVGGVAGAIAAYLGFSEPEKGPLSNFHTFAPDMIDLFTSGIRNNANQIYSEIRNIADNIKSGFTDTEISHNLSVKSQLENIDNIIPEIPQLNYEIDDISRYVSDNISSAPMVKNNPQSVTIQNLNINVEGTNIESDYDVDRMVDRMSDRAIETISGRMKMLGIFSERALGGTAW